MFENKMLPQDITLLICGPLHPTGIDNIPYYLSQGLNVIYSTWKPQTELEHSLLVKVKSLLSNENIVVSEYMDVMNFDNRQNVYYQAWTWSEAVKLCKTSYCIKMRTDLKFNNIEPLIKAVIDNPTKVVCISAFFRPCTNNLYIYCPSDFVIATSTKDTIGITKRLLIFLRNKTFGVVPSEKKICAATLLQRGIRASTDTLEIIRENMRNNYIIVNVNDLKPTMHWHGEGPYYIFNHEHDCSITDINNI